MKEKFAEVYRNLDKASAIAKSLYEENMADYEESERLRIKKRILDRFTAIVRTCSDNDLPITVWREMDGGFCSVEPGSWWARFRTVRKMKGGHWELWYSLLIDHERWVKIGGSNTEESGDAPKGFIIKAVEDY